MDSVIRAESARPVDTSSRPLRQRADIRALAAVATVWLSWRSLELWEQRFGSLFPLLQIVWFVLTLYACAKCLQAVWRMRGASTSAKLRTVRTIGICALIAVDTYQGASAKLIELFRSPVVFAGHHASATNSIYLTLRENRSVLLESIAFPGSLTVLHGHWTGDTDRPDLHFYGIEEQGMEAFLAENYGGEYRVDGSSLRALDPPRTFGRPAVASEHRMPAPQFTADNSKRILFRTP